MVGRLRERWARTQDEALGEPHAGERPERACSPACRARCGWCSNRRCWALGAYLALQREVSPGVMIAASIIMSRALGADRDGGRRNGRSSRASAAPGRGSSDSSPKCRRRQPRMELPQPTGKLAVDNLSAYVPGVEKPIVGGVSFALERGRRAWHHRPDGAGKSTLARALVGAWPLTRGTVQARWRNARPVGSRHVSAGRSAISRRKANSSTARSPRTSRASRTRPIRKAIVNAAQQADIHDLVLGMPDGYNTADRAGRQAAFGRPAPASGAGAGALWRARRFWCWTSPMPISIPTANWLWCVPLQEVRARGGTVIVIAHRPSAIGALDKLMVLKDGRMVGLWAQG